MPLPEPPLTGGCQCGACRYRADGRPVALYICHCTECQRQSASAFGISLIIRAQDFVLLAGAPRVWERPTNSGGRLACAYCPDCGTRLHHRRSAGPEFLSLKGGTLDEPLDLSPAIHIWTARALPGVIIPAETESWPGEPPR